MEQIVDLHVHSHFSRATSPDCNLEGLYRWGKIKGIHTIGTGDFTHPDWFAELREKLEPAEPGLYRLRDSIAGGIDETLPSSVRGNSIRFILTAEICTIYRKHGKVRKLHNIMVAPGFETVSQINTQLERIGNLKADGRPILRLDSKELLRVALQTDKRILYIPAHIWTPWFGMFGSKSGFDSVEEAFEELTPHIRAIETGLSSDPFMNWRVKTLNDITIISNSDAHSPQKLGREATIVQCGLSYDEIIGAIRSNGPEFVGTIEFYPEEGKYHHDGHRACNVCMNPEETRNHNGLCPVCAKPLVVGVDYRVGQLADKPMGYTPENHKTVEYIIPLIELLAELHGVGSGSKKVRAAYNRMIAALGSEFDILRKLPIQQIADQGFTELSNFVGKMRSREIYIQPGYDGVYGVIKIGRRADRET